MGIAIRVISPNGDVEDMSFGTLHTDTMAAEIHGYVTGLLMTPDEATVVLHCDLDGLPQMLRAKDGSYDQPMSTELALLRRVMAKRSVTVIRATGANLQACHDASRKLSGPAREKPSTTPVDLWD